MTLYGFLAAVTWALIGALFIYRLDTFANRWLTVTRVSKIPAPPTEIPDDLTALALGETEKWAQDSVLAVIRERFEQLKDWNKVRTAMGVAQVSA